MTRAQDDRPTRRVVRGKIKERPKDFIVEVGQHFLRLRPKRTRNAEVVVDYTALYERALYAEAVRTVKNSRKRVRRGVRL